MSMPLPNLDDRRFDDLVDEARRLIPAWSPSWTDHNPSDPGITLIELFAYLSDMLLYRVGRVGEDHKRAFVSLLRGPDHVLTRPLADELRLAVQSLKDERRGVTVADFEDRALEVPGVRRAHCVPRNNLDAAQPYADAPAHISVVVVPNEASPTLPAAALTALLRRVQDALLPVCLLTTRLHVVGPRFLRVTVQLAVHVAVDQDEQRVKEAVADHVRACFAPVPRDGVAPWPFGRAVYASDLYASVDSVPGVDYVTPVSSGNALLPVLTTGTAGRQITNDRGEPIGLRLMPDELVWVEPPLITVLRQTDEWPQ